MQPPFICHTCRKRITRKKDLITTTRYFHFYLFHNSCFKKQQLFIPRFIPMNTLFCFFLIIYGLIVGSILMLTGPSIIWLIFLLPILYRFLSYCYVERFFSKQRVDCPLGMLKHSHSFSFNILPM
ncbi:permease [Bacillus toyonensis]|uniref:Permease n=1 Tax=Bacillus toyonensis TaxID=155322 RepID=A0A2C4QPD9_9BACI|nr:permease [Bacillus toyonensis]PHD66937.1 permease [Bacillus toyonensis]